MRFGTTLMITVSMVGMALYTASKLEGPTFTNLRLGSIRGTNMVMQVKSPGGRFSGVAIENSSEAVPPATRIGFLISKNGESVVSLNCAASNLVKSIWIRGEACRLPLEMGEWAANYTDELQRDTEFQIQMTFDRPVDTNAVLWLRFVDSRWLKPTPAGIRNLEFETHDPRIQ
jgi:hypothetical protein